MYPYTVILLRNKKGWSTDIRNNMDKSQKQKHAEWKGSYKKQNETVCTVWFHAYDILEEVKLIWGGKYQNSTCPREGDVAEGIDCNKQERTFQGNDDFCLQWLSYTSICICQQMQQKTQQMCTRLSILL